MTRILFALLALSFVLAVPVPAPAQDAPQGFEKLSAEDKRTLARLMEDAQTAYDKGEFEASVEGFRKAHEIFAHPDLLYRMGLCYERLGEDAAAVRHYRRFLAAMPDAPERARIEKTIETIELRISKSQLKVVTQPDGAVIYIDDVANGPAGYTPAELTIKPGNYRVIVKKEGFEPVEELVTIAAGESLKLRYQLTKIPVVEEPEVMSRNTGKVIGLTSVGVGAAIASIVFFSLYSDAKGTLEDLQAMPSQDVNRRRIEDAETKMYTYLGIGVGTAAVSAGALVWAYLVWKTDTKTASSGQVPLGPSVWWNHGPNVGWNIFW